MGIIYIYGVNTNFDGKRSKRLSGRKKYMSHVYSVGLGIYGSYRIKIQIVHKLCIIRPSTTKYAREEKYKSL